MRPRHRLRRLPDRLYLIGLEGEVVYARGSAPFGFKPEERP